MNKVPDKIWVVDILIVDKDVPTDFHNLINVYISEEGLCRALARLKADLQSGDWPDHDVSWKIYEYTGKETHKYDKHY